MVPRSLRKEGSVVRRRKSIADQLRTEALARIKRGTPQYQLADQAGMQAPTLSRFLAGHRDLSLRQADRLVALFGWEFKAKKGDK